MTDEITSLDATDLRCPLPVLRARKTLKWLPDGALMDVLATDTAAPKDFEAFCRETGHSLIKAKMAETGALLSGEMSGHIFFADRYFGYDDALYAAIRLLACLSQREDSLADIRRSLPQPLNTPELRFPCSEERKFVVVDEVRDRLAEEGANVSDIDGVRVLTDDGWWLLRSSNTQDVLVARCEAATEEGLQRLKDALAAQVRLSGIEPPAF